MDKQKEIEKMASVIFQGNRKCPYNSCQFRFSEVMAFSSCLECKVMHKLYDAGYGDVKQAVREFAENLMSYILECDILDASKICQNIEKLVAEVIANE